MSKNIAKIENIDFLLSNKIRDIYQKQLNHQLNNISYKLFDRTLIIILEGTITTPEKILKNNDNLKLAQEVREKIDNLIQPQIKNIIEESLNVEVIDFLSDSTIDLDLTGAIAIFEKPKQALYNCKF